MVFLHGFSQTGKAFEPIFEIFQPRYSLLSIHIFFHGQSQLDESRPLLPEEWLELIHGIFQKLGIEKGRFLGFSMGCKFALFTAQIAPQLVTSLELLAPDGVVMNPWYRFGARTWFGRMCMRLFLSYLPAMRFLVLMLSRLGLLRPSLGRFVESQLASSAQRKRVLSVWIMFRNIWPNWNILPEKLISHHISTRIVLGRFDSIIPLPKFERQREKWKFVNWQVLDAGHSGLVDKYASEIRNGRLDSQF